MARPYAPFFLIFTYLSLLISAEAGAPTCPSSFSCQNLSGSFTFPFYNTSDTRCGLCKFACRNDAPNVQLGEKGQWYEIKQVLQSDELVIHDKAFASLVNMRSCDIFRNISFPSYPSISFTMSNNITIIKCPNTADLAPITDNYFSSNYSYYSYRKCQGYNIYYKNPVNQSSNPVNHPASCSKIQLPLPVPGSNFNAKNASDLFELLSAEYPLQFDVLDDCGACRDNGGFCENHKQRFRCGYPGKGTPKKFFTGIAKVIAYTLVGGVSITAILALCHSWTKYSTIKAMILQKFKRKDNVMVEDMLNQYGPLAATRYKYKDVKKMTMSFKFKLGQGGYGSVYKGILQDGRFVAVKILNNPKGSAEEFVNEVISISKTSHVNVVTLVGFCYEGSKRALVYEFMPNGSLDKFIHKEESWVVHQLRPQKLYEIAIGISRGLEYLHRGCNTRILHLDIKPQNILLDDEFCPKIADFGLAKLCFGKDSVVSMLGMRGTPGYIAPEVFSRNFGGVSHKSDVYSYGMMILEMIEGKYSSNKGHDHSSEQYFPDSIYNRLELGGENGWNEIANGVENECTRKMILVGLWCIQTDPSVRPSMRKVMDMLAGSLESLQLPPKPLLISSPKFPADCSISTT